MKTKVERRKPEGFRDYFALAFTTWGVGYLPIAPGTWGSAVAVAIYVVLGYVTSSDQAHLGVLLAVLLTIFCLAGIWASDRSVPLLGSLDPSEAVVDELMGQFITFAFVPFGVGWPFLLAGFLLFRFFDIFKPYPIDDLQVLPGGLGICADDIVAGVYAGICLAVIYAVSLSIW